jgi:hypothetical protein
LATDLAAADLLAVELVAGVFSSTASEDPLTAKMPADVVKTTAARPP